MNKPETPSPPLVVGLDRKVSRHLKDRLRTRSDMERGWLRRNDAELGAVTWRMWARKGPQIYAYVVTVSLMELRNAGRISAALALRKARREMAAAMAPNSELTRLAEGQSGGAKRNES